MYKLLIISPSAFHNKIGQAGHKTLNFYVSKFSVDFDVTVLSLADSWDKESGMMVHDHPNVHFITNRKKKNIIQKLRDRFLFRKVYPFLKMFNPSYYLSNGFHQRRLQYLLNKIDKPEEFDYVLVEFTSMIFQYNVIKSYLPKAKFIASCVDVSFQSVERWVENASVKISKQKYFEIFKNLEVNYINKFDLIILQNQKDYQLLSNEESIQDNKLHVINPYFDTYPVKISEPDGIVFFGAMNRPENINSIKWFLQNVWSEISKRVEFDLKFYVVGGGVSNEFRTHCNQYKNLVITGFVENPTIYFNRCYAMVVPLIFGAGIKVKSIEAMASGIPLISNEIGIEGIPAVAGKDYIHCETSDEWINAVDLVVKNMELRKSLTSNGLNLVNNYFNIERSYIDYKDRIQNL